MRGPASYVASLALISPNDRDKTTLISSSIEIVLFYFYVLAALLSDVWQSGFVVL